MNKRDGSLLFMYTETALHTGSGSTVSAIDLPIQRERITNFPNIQGSGVKGALRSRLSSEWGEGSEEDHPDILRIFGNKPGQPNIEKMHAGSASFGEGRIVLFPVRALQGVFAHVTCPFVLGRLARDMAYAGLKPLPIPTEPIAEDTCLVSPNSQFTHSREVVLEEYAFTPDSETFDVHALATWLANNALPQGDEYAYWRESLAQRLVILTDDAFRDFVSTSTEITTHIKINTATKTVDSKKGALWTKESLPSDTLIATTVMAHDSRKPDDNQSADDVLRSLVQALQGRRTQIGGDETTGNGVVALNWYLTKMEGA